MERSKLKLVNLDSESVIRRGRSHTGTERRGSRAGDVPPSRGVRLDGWSQRGAPPAEVPRAAKARAGSMPSLKARIRPEERSRSLR